MIQLPPTRQNVRAMLAMLRLVKTDIGHIPPETANRCIDFFRQRDWPVWHVALDPEGAYVGIGRTPDDALDDATEWSGFQRWHLDVYPASDAFLELPEGTRPAYPQVIDGKVSALVGRRRLFNAGEWIV